MIRFEFPPKAPLSICGGVAIALQSTTLISANAPLLIYLKLEGRVTTLNPELAKATLPMEVMPSGMAIDTERLVQLKNAEEGISVRFLPNVTLESFVQPLNTPLPRVVTESGITMLIKEVQPAKASFSIEVTQSGRITASRKSIL